MFHHFFFFDPPPPPRVSPFLAVRCSNNVEGVSSPRYWSDSRRRKDFSTRPCFFCPPLGFGSPWLKSLYDHRPGAARAAFPSSPSFLVLFISVFSPTACSPITEHPSTCASQSTLLGGPLWTLFSPPRPATSTVYFPPDREVTSGKIVGCSLFAVESASASLSFLSVLKSSVSGAPQHRSQPLPPFPLKRKAAKLGRTRFPVATAQVSRNSRPLSPFPFPSPAVGAFVFSRRRSLPPDVPS